MMLSLRSVVLLLSQLLLSAFLATACDDNTTTTPDTPPVHYGMILFPAFQALDVFGPLDAFNILATTPPMTVLNLSLIAATLDPVSTQPRSHGAWSSFAQAIVPTHTFASPPENLEVLFVPGGSGTRAPDLGPAIDYIRDVYPSLRYIISICTGSWLLARAGVLEGRNATTNKASWASRPLMNGTVNWVPHARWVVDGNIWTSSGVSAGIDATLAFMEATFGADVAQRVTNGMEYTRHTNASYDPFAELHGL